MNLYAYVGNDPANAVDPFGLAFEKPGFWGSMVPVVGLWRSMAHYSYNNNWGMFTLHAAEFALDVSLVGGLAKSVSKGAIKTGSSAWKATRSWYGTTRSLPAYTQVHHWLVPQRA